MFFRTGSLAPKSSLHDRLFFVCPFVHLVAWYKSLHDCVNLAPQCVHSYIIYFSCLSRSVIKEGGSLWIPMVIGRYFSSSSSSSSSSGINCPRNTKTLSSVTSLTMISWLKYLAINWICCKGPPLHLEFIYCENVLCHSSCYSQIILFVRSSMHFQTTKHGNCSWTYPTHTNPSWSAAILANALPPQLPGYGPTYSCRIYILCWAKRMFHLSTLLFLVSVSSLLPLQDCETTDFSFLLPTMEF